MGNTKFKSIEELFNHVLGKYEEAEVSLIWEYSGHIEESEKILKAEIECYKSELRKSCGKRTLMQCLMMERSRE